MLNQLAWIIIKKADAQDSKEVTDYEIDYTACAEIAVGEIGIRLYDYYDMSWEEFSMLSNGFAKKREREMEDIKFIAWHSMVGTRLEKIPSFEQFVQGKKPAKASQSQRELFLQEAMRHYNSKKK